MKQWRKHRLVAVLLLVCTLIGALPFTAVYADEGAGGAESAVSESEKLYGGKTLEEILQLTSGMNYNTYSSKWAGKTQVDKDSDRDYEATEVIVPKGEKSSLTGEVLTTSDYKTGTFDGVDGIYMPASGKTTFKIFVPQDGLYSIDLKYFPISEFEGKTVGTKTTIERMFYLDEELPFNECRYLYIPRCWGYVGTDGKSELYKDGEPRRSSYDSDDAYEAAYSEWLKSSGGGAGNYVWDTDIEDNDIRPDRVETPEWRTYFLRDWLGYTVEPFQFYLTAGDHYFTFEATREPLVVSNIKIYGYNAENSYETVLERWIGSGAEIYTGDSVYVIEAESPYRVSDQVLFPGTDRTSSLNSPSHPSNLVYNIANSSVVGQYMTYRVYVEEEGLYNIMARFRQNTMAGMFTSRRIRINGEIPFKEASYLKFNYDTSFQNVLLGNGEDGKDKQDYLFYFEEGWNTVEIEVVLGDMSAYIYDIAAIISTLNSDYQKILMVTGTNPDNYRDYGFSRLLPDVMSDLANAAMKLDEVYTELVELTGATGQHIATLDTIRTLVSKMALDEYEIAPNFLSFKNYLTALSNWLYTSLSQPLKLDYLRIQGEDTKVPRAKANFFYAIAYEAKAFVASFFKDYNVIGFKSDNEAREYKGTILMWNTTSREDALILRTMIDSTFTPDTDIAVNIRYVAQGLQESILAGVGPDVAMMASGTAVSWGLRHAVEDLSAKYTQADLDNGRIPEGKNVGDDVYSGFSELCPKDDEGEFVVPDPEYYKEHNKFNVQFSHAALEAVSLSDKTYLIPCTMNYEMAFYRVDVFAQYGLTPPRTWQELNVILPNLINNHMTMGMQTALAGYQMLLYQMGETMYADDYKRFNSSVTCLEAFDRLCSLFTDYSLPVSYDLTRFRTGEIPIVVANWTTYNTFMGYYELRGMWTIESLIGWENDDGTVNRSSILNVEGIVIPKGSDNPQNVWEYIKWYSGDDTQTRLARQQLAVSANTTAKYNTANLNALLSQAWTDAEKEAMFEQIPHLKGIPYNPGDYNISRYVNFAFMAVYNTKADAVDQILDYVVDIDKELSRKRKEYHLEYIDYYTGETVPAED